MKQYSNITFWGGTNLYNGARDYRFDYNPTVDDKYASVAPPKILDDWYPRLYAKLNNKKILKRTCNKDILLIDFVNYGH